MGNLVLSYVPQGCYIGQESISRVNAYKAIKTALYGIVFDDNEEDEEGARGSVSEGDQLVVQETGAR